MDTHHELTARCPQCRSVFRVQPQHLAAAKGWVQCGICGKIFHTVVEQTISSEPDRVEAPQLAAATALSPDTSQGQFAGADARSVPGADMATDATDNPASTAKTESKTKESDEPLAEAAPLPGLAQRMAEHEAETTPFGPKLESIILVDPDIPADDPGPLPVIENPEEPEGGSSRFMPDDTLDSTSQTSNADASDWTPRPSPPTGMALTWRKGWLWTLLALILLLALAAQLTYFLRDDLAVRYPALRPHLASLCDALDCRVSLPRGTRQVVILGSDLQTGGSGHLTLSVTLANRARHAMAWPMLELTLTNLNDQPVGRKLFAPSEYLPSPELEAAGIQPLSEVPLRLEIATRGLKAAGYRLQMFY